MDLLLEVFKGNQVFRYTIVSAATLVCYEYLIMLHNEIRYLWARRISFGGVLLFLCRYVPFASVFTVYVYISESLTDPNHSNCTAGFRASICIVYVQFLLSTLVLFTRAYAVWEGSMKILSLLVLSYAGITSNGCIPEPLNNDLWIGLAILIFSESLAFGLLIIKSVRYARAFKNVARISSRKSIMPVMVQDGIGYFACTLAITTANLIVLKGLTPAIQDCLFIMQSVLQDILCSRLMFHIRAVNDPSVDTLASQTSSSNASHEHCDVGNPADPGPMLDFGRSEAEGRTFS